jgi:hypothetical protein
MAASKALSYRRALSRKMGLSGIVYAINIRGTVVTSGKALRSFHLVSGDDVAPRYVSVVYQHTKPRKMPMEAPICLIVELAQLFD